MTENMNKFIKLLGDNNFHSVAGEIFNVTTVPCKQNLLLALHDAFNWINEKEQAEIITFMEGK